MRERISQAGAARLRGVTRQRINELVKLGRIDPARNDEGELLGGLWLDEVKALDLKSVGRPRKETIESRFREGDVVLWERTPRRSFGFTVTIEATVLKVSAIRLKLSFVDSEGKEHISWASQEDCKLVEMDSKIPDSGKSTGYELNYFEKLHNRML